MPKEILSNTYNRVLDSSLTEEFPISAPRIYLIKIQARAKAWWQNLSSFFKRFFSKDGPPNALKTTLVAWNRGPTYVSENYPLNFDEIPDTTKKLIDFVLKQK